MTRVALALLTKAGTTMLYNFYADALSDYVHDHATDDQCDRAHYVAQERTETIFEKYYQEALDDILFNEADDAAHNYADKILYDSIRSWLAENNLNPLSNDELESINFDYIHCDMPEAYRYFQARQTVHGMLTHITSQATAENLITLARILGNIETFTDGAGPRVTLTLTPQELNSSAIIDPEAPDAQAILVFE